MLVLLIFRLFVVYILYFLCRILFVFINLSSFPGLGFSEFMGFLFYGLRFDTSAIIYTNILIILMHIIPFKFRYNHYYQVVSKWLFYVVNSLAIIINMSDSIYYKFTLKRTTFSVFSEFSNENPLSFIRFIWDYWYVSLLIIALIYLMVFAYNAVKVSSPPKMIWYKYYSFSLITMAIVVILCIGGMRGGFAHSTRPITLSNASAYITRPEYRAIVLNTPFAIIRTIGKDVLEDKKYFSQSELKEIFTAEKQLDSVNTYNYGKLKGRNVVLIIWESFSKEWVGALNKNIENYSGYTPFIDSLINHSYVFSNSYANGRKSIDAIPSVIASIPSAKTPFVLSNYSGNRINSLASTLSDLGYNTSFFHGAANGSMGFDAFVKQADFDNYYGRSEYNDDSEFDGLWGIWDEPFLSFMNKKINNFKEPFLSVVFTLSSHHPFKIPKKYEGKFPKGNIPIHQCIGYTDNSLREFFKNASKEDWFNNTLFVIVADHSVQGYLPEYNNAVGAFSVPIIFYAPNSNLLGFNDSIAAQQIDIMPTVLGLLGYNKKIISFGDNLFSLHNNHYSFTYFDGVYQIIWKNFLLQYSQDMVSGIYDISNDANLKENLLGKYPEIQNRMERKIKGFIQEYNHRLINNKLTID